MSDASTSSFCTMGGMMMSHNALPMHQRKLDTMPVILPDDDDGGEHDHNKDKQMDSHHDHGSSSMNHDHSSHNMPNMNMDQGTAMYMDGFHSALFPSSQHPPPPCLNLFHPSWTLHTPSKFLFAMVFVLLMGVMVEACGVWRVKCLRKGRSERREARMKRIREREVERAARQDGNRQGQQLEFRPSSSSQSPRGTIQHGASDISDVSSSEALPSPPTTAATPSVANPICPAIVRRIWRTAVPKFIRTTCCASTRILCCCCFFHNTKPDGTKLARRYDFAAASLHATRAVLGYLLMLSVMTYAVEFFICSVAGMVLGRHWFVDMEAGGRAAGGGVMNGAVGVGGGIGGMGLGDGGGGGDGRQNSGQGVGMSDLHNGGGGNDGTWGGGDPCCGIDDDDEDENHNHDGLKEPLLSSLMGSSNVGVTRRSGGLQMEGNP
ncbi:hypothetical protein ACHAXR_011354 [Thalassiosira sp. AJA248-18]